MHLKLNPDKTEFIMCSYRSQLVKFATNCVSISDSTIPRNPSVKYLGVTLDENHSLKEHILLKCRKAMANFVMIHNIQKFLTRDACTTLVLGLCISHLDYAICAKLTLKKSSFDKTRLTVPFTKCRTFATQSYSMSALTVWNQLPSTLREIANFKLFERQLKTHYYCEAFY